MYMKAHKTKLVPRLLQLCAGLVVVCALTLTLVGRMGVPSEMELNKEPWKGSTVFELSPERGRFALTYAIVERSSFFLTRELARFASPDVGYHNGQYVSIFAPLLSILLVPGYIIGKFFGASQVGTGVIIVLAALCNVLLIRSIAIKLKANNLAATAAGLIFLFATPAFPYAVNIYQHHISTLFLLVSIHLYISSSSWLSLAGIFFLSGLAIPLDYPNAFLMFPIALASCWKILYFEKSKSVLSMTFSPKLFTSMFVVLIPLGLFMYFNAVTYGGPFTLSGTVQTLTFDDQSGSIKQDLSTIPINTEIEKQIDEKGARSAVGFFQTRNILNGLYIQFVSPDRGIFVYAPLMILGLLGSIVLMREHIRHVPLIMAVIGANIVLYAMWGDPWGGWAFGSRYLIPSYALISILFALLATRLRHSTVFITLTLLLVNYSVAVNSLGALTSLAIPPQIQVLELERISGVVQKYTFERSYDLLMVGRISSFMYQTFMNSVLTPIQLFAVVGIPIVVIIAFMFLYLYAQNSPSQEL